jgi:zeaxanthin glucosyltransferase
MEEKQHSTFILEVAYYRTFYLLINFLHKIMKTVLFSILPAWGHLNPNIQLAKHLQKLGYRCVFATTIEFREVIIKNNFELVLAQSQPFGVGSENHQDEETKRPYLENIMDRFQDLSYNARKKDYQKWLKDYQPDLILVDAFYSTDFILLEPLIRHLDIRLIFSQIMLATNNDGFTPPLNTFILPDNTSKVKIAWQRMKIRRALLRAIDFLRFLGLSNFLLIKRKFEQNQISERYAIDYDKVFHITFQNVEEWILAPKEIEFSGKPPKVNQYYLGLMTETQEQALDDELKSFVNEAKKQHKKIIYVSLGTLHSTHTKGKSRFFFKNILSVFEPNNDVFLVLSVGKELKSILKTQSKQIKIMDSVSQRGLLPYVDIFITHGGINSVLESSYAGKPMLVLPLNNQWDQNGDAARVVYHGLGIKANLQDTKDVIQKMINELLNNPIYQQKAQVFSKVLHEKYSNENFLEDFFCTELLVQ